MLWGTCLKLVIVGLSVQNQKLYNIVLDTRTFYQSLGKSTSTIMTREIDFDPSY